MSEVDPTQQAQNTASALKTIVDLAADHPEFKKAATNLAMSANTVTALLDNCLIPIAIVNYGFKKGRDYFEKVFPSELNEKLAEVPQENLVEPPASIAAPILQALTFAHEDKNLKEMFLNLLKSTMDSRVSSHAHPGFVDVIRQLSPEEARLLSGVLKQEVPWPIVQIRISKLNGTVYNLIRTHVMNICDEEVNLPVVISRLDLMIENWIRLGLVNVQYTEKLNDAGIYDWVDARPELQHERKVRLDQEIVWHPGTLRVTAFGRSFAVAVQ